jgi:hypothetical protein
MSKPVASNACVGLQDLTIMSKPVKLVISLAVAFPLAVVLVIGTGFVVIPLKNSAAHWLFALVNERGPFVYLAIFFGYVVIITGGIMATGTGSGQAIGTVLQWASVLPLLAGLAGMLLGYVALWTSLALYPLDELSEADRAEALASIAMGKRTAWDPLIVGGVIAAGSLTVATLGKAKSNNRWKLLAFRQRLSGERSAENT